MANPESLKDKVGKKSLICRQVGHWVKEFPNHGKPSETACYKCHQLGLWATLCPWDPRTLRSSAKPSLMMALKGGTAHTSQPTCHGWPSRSSRQGCNWMWQVALNISWLTPRATYSVLTSYSGAFSLQTCTILVTTGKTITKKIHPSTSLLLGWTDIILLVSGGPWMPHSLVEKSYTHQAGNHLVIGNFSAPRALQLMILLRNPLCPL